MDGNQEPDEIPMPTPSPNSSETPSRDEREAGDVLPKTEPPHSIPPSNLSVPIVVTERTRRISGPERTRNISGSEPSYARRGSLSSRRSFSRGALSVSELHLYQKATEESAALSASQRGGADASFVVSSEGTPVEFVSPTGGSIWKFTKKQWTILLLFSIADLLAGIVYSLQAPFYPEEVITLNTFRFVCIV